MSAVKALAAVVEPAGLGRFVRRSWHIVGAERHPVRRELAARSAEQSFGADGRPTHPHGTAVLLGEEFRPGDNAALLDGIAAATRDGGRLALLHNGAGGASLLRAAAIENPRLDVLSVELPARPSPRATRLAVTLAGSDGLTAAHVRVDDLGWVGRTRWHGTDLPAAPRPTTAEPSAVLVTGGLGGLGLRAAGVLAHHLGMHPVLVDVRRPPDLPADAAAHLRRLGRSCTVLTTDITNPRRTAASLSTVDIPPVRAVVHCAGLLCAGAVSGLSCHDLLRCQQVKVAGLRNVLAALDTRELRRLVVFGSITAERAHRGLGGYALANELLSRATLRAAHEHPDCAVVVAEWSLWSGAGMAHRMGAAAQARGMGMAPVSLRAGMATLLRLFGWPAGPAAATRLLLPSAEDLVTARRIDLPA